MDSYKAAAGAGEARRRIDVVYFLSRGGRTEQPHLFRVGHHHRAGVRLRDVKRWLSELRGKDMPGNFSWSYKRRYRAGYLWQDLKDDDLITPISDNEYVLLGCDVRGTPPPPCADARNEKFSSLDEKKQDEQGDEAPCDQKQVEEVLQVTAGSEECSPEPPRAAAAAASDQDKKQQEEEEEELVKKTVTKAVVVTRAAPAGSKKHPAARARRMRVAQALHNILTCGAADADDAALRPVLRQSAGAGAGDDWPRTPVCPGIDGCGLRMSRKARSRRGGKDKAKRDGGDAHKPACLPRCSQCGKEFKPQELHSHMQSCRGLRERMRSGGGGGGNRSATATRPESGRGGARPASCSPERLSTTALLLTESLSVRRTA